MEERNENEMTVRSSIGDDKFKYHILKGRLSKNSIISKQVHPIEEVELFKKRLIKNNLLKDCDEYWCLKDSIKVGLLMALNLHFGKMIKENPCKQTITVSHFDAQNLKNKLPVNGLRMTDSTIVKMLDCDSYKIDGLFKLEINKSFLSNHDSNTFGLDEKLVLSIMQRAGIVSQSARHGNAKNKEADIVDENEGMQYEIIYEFKNSLKPKKMAKLAFDPGMFLIQLIDNEFIHPSKALRNKFTKKDYIGKFKKGLVIFNVGSIETSKAMLNPLLEMLKNEKEIKSDFEKLFIISYDFISQEIYFIQLDPYIFNSYSCNNEEIGFVKMTPHNFAHVNCNESYLLICRNIFNGQTILRYDSGQELLNWVKEMRIFL